VKFEKNREFEEKSKLEVIQINIYVSIDLISSDLLKVR
jgi:hypothetical protein